MSDERSRRPVARLRWRLMPWWAFAWRWRWPDDPPSTWWQKCIGSATWWADKLLERLPGAALFEFAPRPPCTCDYCRGIPGAVFEP